MKRKLFCLIGAWFVCPALLVVPAHLAAQQQPAAKYVAKSKIEIPAKSILADKSGAAPDAKGGAFVNPKVQPGKVKWHADYETACKASKQSGKPVLLFQMMGKLDDQFC
jgi:hypothetical protein